MHSIILIRRGRLKITANKSDLPARNITPHTTDSELTRVYLGILDRYIRIIPVSNRCTIIRTPGVGTPMPMVLTIVNQSNSLNNTSTIHNMNQGFLITITKTTIVLRCIVDRTFTG